MGPGNFENNGSLKIVPFSLTTLALVTLLAGPADSAGKEPAELFMHANAAYEAGEHEKAAELYQRLLEEGIQNGHIYYNLGNSLLRGGRLGRAIAAYRKAKSLLPRDSDVRANLQFARKATKDAMEPEEPSAVLQTLFFWHFSLSTRELLLLIAIVNLLFWSALAIQRFRRQSEWLRWAVALLFVSILVLGSSFGIRTLLPTELAVINSYEVNVRSGISRDTVVRFKLHEGAETELIDEQGDWLRIALPDGKQGWVERKHVLIATL